MAPLNTNADDVDKVDSLVALAGRDPVRARAVATRYARAKAAPAGAAFFEQACRALVVAGHQDVAQHCFTLARKADAGRSPVADVHPVLLEFVPAQIVTPTILRDYAKQLAAEVPGAEAHTKFREIICTALDAGFVPYANLFADLRTLAGAAGIRRAAEDDFLAEYLLRSGTLAVAPFRVWGAAEKALVRITKRDRSLMDLLAAAEPDAGFELADANRRIWLEVLLKAGAGKALPAQWFLTNSRLPLRTLAELARSAGSALFTESDPGDPALFGIPADSPSPDPLPDPDDLLRWAAGGGLADLDAALTVLQDLATKDGLAGLGPEFVKQLQIVDPADALVTALRSGLPAEFEGRDFRDHVRPEWKYRSEIRVVQDGDRLTYVSDLADVRVFTPQGLAHHIDVGNLRSAPDDMLLWHDGSDLLFSRRQRNGWQTYVYQGTDQHDRILAGLDHRRSTGPTASSLVEVWFPGADRPTKIDCADGKLRVHTADGAIASSFDFGPVQDLTWGVPAALPPGWLAHQYPVDPAGSAALRGIDRDAANRLIEAALLGADAASPAVDELGVTDPRLRRAVARSAAIAARCLTARLTISGLTKAAPPRQVLPVLIPNARLPVERHFAILGVWRKLAELVRETVKAPPKDEAYEVGRFTFSRPCRDAALLFGSLGGRALRQVWAFDPDTMDLLAASVSSGFYDGSGRWRMVILKEDHTDHYFEHMDGRLYRTPTGSAVTLLRESVTDPALIEYSPDGRFSTIDMPGWEQYAEPVPQGWATPDRIADFRSLLSRNGPLPIQPDLAWDLAAACGIAPQDAAGVLFGSADHAMPLPDPSRYPQQVIEAYEAAAADRWGTSTIRDRAATYLREQLMPADPADLWTRGPDLEAAAQWWWNSPFKDERW